jgi:hypothetical protein
MVTVLDEPGLTAGQARWAGAAGESSGRYDCARLTRQGRPALRLAASESG